MTGTRSRLIYFLPNQVEKYERILFLMQKIKIKINRILDPVLGHFQIARQQKKKAGALLVFKRIQQSGKWKGRPILDGKLR
jgi:hypothetical protein